MKNKRIYGNGKKCTRCKCDIVLKINADGEKSRRAYCDKCFHEIKHEYGLSQSFIKRLHEGRYKSHVSMFQKPRVSEKLKIGGDHYNCITTVLIAPDFTKYNIKNLAHFVRTHAYLFHPDDVLWKPKTRKSKIKEFNYKPSLAEGALWCRAQCGLTNIANGRDRVWKGWRLK